MTAPVNAGGASKCYTVEASTVGANCAVDDPLVKVSIDTAATCLELSLGVEAFVGALRTGDRASIQASWAVSICEEFGFIPSTCSESTFASIFRGDRSIFKDIEATDSRATSGWDEIVENVSAMTLPLRRTRLGLRKNSLWILHSAEENALLRAGDHVVPGLATIHIGGVAQAPIEGIHGHATEQLIVAVYGGRPVNVQLHELKIFWETVTIGAVA